MNTSSEVVSWESSACLQACLVDFGGSAESVCGHLHSHEPQLYSSDAAADFRHQPGSLFDAEDEAAKKVPEQSLASKGFNNLLLLQEGTSAVLF